MGRLKNFVIYGLLPVLILGTIFWYGFGGNFLQKSVLKIKSENNFVDFGILQRSNNTFSKSVILKNISHKDLIIKKIYTDCECTSVSFVLNGHKYTYSLPKDLNERPVNLFIPKDLDFSVTVNLTPTYLQQGNFSGYLYFEPNSGKVLKLNIRSRIR